MLIDTPRSRIAGSDRPAFTGLTQFCRWDISACVQTIEENENRRETLGRQDVCDNLFLTARNLLILNTERCPSG